MSMARQSSKIITFDLFTNKMRAFGVYPNGYNQLRRKLNKLNFDHMQGTVYMSRGGMPKAEVIRCLVDITKNDFPWLKDCMNSCIVAFAGKKVDITDTYLQALSETQKATQGKNDIKTDEPKQPSHADQVSWVLENCGERIAEDIAANKSRQAQQVGKTQQVRQVQQVRQGGQGKSATSRKVRSK